MSTLYSILIVFEAIVCFLLIGIVLLQKSTGDGNGLSFGAGAESVFGAQAGNVLTRGTVVLAILFLLNTLVLCILRPEARAKTIDAELAEEQAKAAAAAVPESSDAADLLDTATDAVDLNAADVLDSAAQAVEQKAEDAAKAVEEKAEDAAKAVEEKVEDAAKAVEEKVEDVAKAVEEKAEDAAKAVEQKAEDAAKAVEEKAE